MANNSYLFEGKTAIVDFIKILNLDIDFSDVQGDADSLAGLLLEIKGDFPVIHEKISYSNIGFEVVGIDNRRISKIKVTINDADIPQ